MKNLSVKDSERERRNGDSIQLIDVRTQAEFDRFMPKRSQSSLGVLGRKELAF